MSAKDKDELVKLAKKITGDPSQILSLAIIKELRRIGILSPDEVKNISQHFYSGLTKLTDLTNEEIAMYMFPLQVLEDSEETNELLKKMGIKL